MCFWWMWLGSFGAFYKECGRLQEGEVSHTEVWQSGSNVWTWTNHALDELCVARLYVHFISTRLLYVWDRATVNILTCLSVQLTFCPINNYWISFHCLEQSTYQLWMNPLWVIKSALRDNTLTQGTLEARGPACKGHDAAEVAQDTEISQGSFSDCRRRRCHCPARHELRPLPLLSVSIPATTMHHQA